MDNSLMEKLLRLLKSDQEIMSLLKIGNYDSILCGIGVQLLSEEGNIISIIEKTKYNWSVCKASIDSMKMFQKSEEQILFIMQKTNYNQLVCKAGIKFLRLEKSFISFIKASHGYGSIDEEVRLAVSFLQFENKSEEEIFSIILDCDYQEIVCEEALKYIKSEKYLIAIIENKGWFRRIDPLEIATSLLSFKGKSEEEIFEIIKKSRYNMIVISKALEFVKLEEKTDSELFLLLEKSGFASNLCIKFADFLKFEGISDDEIIEIIVKSGFNEDISKRWLLFLKDKKTYLRVIEKSKYEEVICRNWVAFLDKEYQKDKYMIDISEEEIVRLINKLSSNFLKSPVVLYWIKSLKKEKNIQVLLKDDSKDYDQRVELFRMLLSKLNTINSLVLFHYSYKRDEELSKMVIAQLDLAKKSEEDVLLIIKETHFNSWICLEAIKYLKSENIILSFLEENVDHLKYKNKDEGVWPIVNLIKSRKKILKLLCLVTGEKEVVLLKTDTQIMNFFQNFYKESGSYLEIVLVLMSMIIKSQDILISLLGIKDYKDYMSLGLKKIIIAQINLNGKTDTEIFSLIKKSKYDYVFFCEAIKFLKSDNYIISAINNIFKGHSFAEDFIESVLSSLSMENRSDNKILNIFDKVNYNKQICEYGLKYLKNEDSLIFVLLKFEDQYHGMIEKILPFLKIEVKSDKKIMSIIEKSNYNKYVCSFAIQFLKKRDNIILILEKFAYSEFICEVAIVALEKIG